MFFADLHFKTGVDLVIKKANVFHIAALPNGHAAVHRGSQVLIMNGLGQVIRRIDIGFGRGGLFGLGVGLQASESFLAYFGNGTVFEMQSQDGRILNAYHTGIKPIVNRASSYTDKCNIPKDTIFFAKYVTRFSHVFSYNVSSKTRKLNVKGLHGVYSVSSGCVNGSVVYIVSECSTHKVHVYNASWSRIASFGGRKSGVVKFGRPFSAAMSEQGHIYVADHDHFRVSMFTSNGQFVKHILTCKYPYKPWILSVRGRYLWLTLYRLKNLHYNRVIRYILY